MGATRRVTEHHHDIVLFDGVCGFCEGSVRFILDHECDDDLRFAPLDSPVGRALLLEHGLDPDDRTTFVFINGAGAFVRSDATMWIATHLRHPWCWIRVFRRLPRWLLDLPYDLIARNRYRWFGRHDACRLLTPDLAARFLPGSADTSA
jgi:predicted DCC family thiol-disulfide oxidoreductase YuxK